MAVEDGEDACEHLEYRASDAEHEFDTPRAYCTVVDAFVQPVRADVCNARYDLSPAEHCEYYREAEGLEDPWLVGDGAGDDDGASGENGNDAAPDGDEGGETA